jgi:DNA polymerase III epsilon subunit-like protein
MLYISVDTEASGPVPALFNLVSIGAVPVREEGGRFALVPGKRFYAELKPVFPGFNPEAMAVHGIPREHLERTGLEPPKAMAAFRQWVLDQAAGSTVPPVFVGHNAAFDWAYVNFYFLHTGVANPFEIFALDTKAIAFGRYGLPWEKCRKSEFAEIFRDLPALDEKARHRADYDAEYQAHILCVLMNAAPGAPPARPVTRAGKP